MDGINSLGRGDEIEVDCCNPELLETLINRGWIQEGVDERTLKRILNAYKSLKESVDRLGDCQTTRAKYAAFFRLCRGNPDPVSSLDPYLEASKEAEIAGLTESYFRLWEELCDLARETDVHDAYGGNGSRMPALSNVSDLREAMKDVKGRVRSLGVPANLPDAYTHFPQVRH